MRCWRDGLAAAAVPQNFGSVNWGLPHEPDDAHVIHRRCAFGELVTVTSELSLGDIQEIARSVAGENFGSKISDVTVMRRQDYDGDDVLVVHVFVRTGVGTLNPTRATGLVRHLRSHLSSQGEETFPVISFISENERDLVERAAA